MKTKADYLWWILSALIFILVLFGPMILITIFINKIIDMQGTYQGIIIFATIIYYFGGLMWAVTEDDLLD